MDDPQLEAELAALAAPQARNEKPSEAAMASPHPGGAPANTETDYKLATTQDFAEAHDDAGADLDASGEGDAAFGDDETGDRESDTPDDDERPRKRKSGIVRLKERLAVAEAEAAALRSRVSPGGEPSQSDIERLIGRPPNENDFNGDFLAYERALTAYEVDRRQTTRDMRSQAAWVQHARQAAMREAADAHHERIEQFRERVGDFDQTLHAAAALRVAPVVEHLILDSDKSAHLVYHLAKNPERLAKLNAMNEREAAREVGRLESRLSLPNTRTQTKAPPPKTPPRGGSAPASQHRDLDAYLRRTYG